MIDIWPQTLNLQQEDHSAQQENSIITGKVLATQTLHPASSPHPWD